MPEPFESTERPSGMTDNEWLSVGLLCLTQLVEQVAKLLWVDDKIELEVGMVYFGLFGRQVENWFLAHFEALGTPIDRDEAKKLALEFGDKMLHLRMEIARLKVS